MLFPLLIFILLIVVCGSSEDEDSSSTSLNESSSNQYFPSTVIGSKAPGERLENMSPLSSQLNHKGLISMASDQPQ